jgi:hypothetical protein
MSRYSQICEHNVQFMQKYSNYNKVKLKTFFYVLMVELQKKMINHTVSAFQDLLTGHTNTDYSPEDIRKAKLFLNVYAERDMSRVVIMRELSLPKGTIAKMEKLYRRYKEGSL